MNKTRIIKRVYICIALAIPFSILLVVLFNTLDMRFVRKLNSLMRSKQLNVYFQNWQTKEWAHIKTITGEHEIQNIARAFIEGGTSQNWRSGCPFDVNLVFLNEDKVVSITVGTDDCRQFIIDGSELQGSFDLSKSNLLKDILQLHDPTRFEKSAIKTANIRVD